MLEFLGDKAMKNIGHIGFNTERDGHKNSQTPQLKEARWEECSKKNQVLFILF